LTFTAGPKCTPQAVGVPPPGTVIVKPGATIKIGTNISSSLSIQSSNCPFILIGRLKLTVNVFLLVDVPDLSRRIQ